MDPIIAVYSIHLTIRASDDAPPVDPPTSKAIEDACAAAVGALGLFPEGYTGKGTVTVNADAVRTDS